jgi:hypothetical protein
MLTDKERRAAIKDDPSTYFGHTHDEAGGRFQKQVPTNVSGKDPATLYPKLPTSSHWSNDPVPPEAPLGIDVTETPIVGESFEVEQSLNQDFGWRKTIQDGASRQHEQHARPGASGFSIGPTGSPNPVNTSASPVCVGGDDATAVSPSSPSGLPRPVDRDLGKGPHVASEKEGSENSKGDGVGALPSRSNLIRRLR